MFPDHSLLAMGRQMSMPIGQNIGGLQRCVVQLLPKERLVFVAPVKLLLPSIELDSLHSFRASSLFPETCGLDGFPRESSFCFGFRIMTELSLRSLRSLGWDSLCMTMLYMYARFLASSSWTNLEFLPLS
jgi:hypothetical protein